MKKITLLLLLSVSLFSCKTKSLNKKFNTTAAQAKLDFTYISDLSHDITETSGLEYYQNQFITHNDSGDLPTLYFLNDQGHILKRRTYKHMNAVDWEDVTKDDEFLYIADIGNNYGDRDDLVIYKIRLDEIDNEDAVVSTLHITYPDQRTFTRSEQNHPYDAESIVAVNDKLYLFSKDWKDQTTVVYKIDKNKIVQNAQKVTSGQVKGLITGATYNGKNLIMLCGYNSDLTPFIIPVTYQDGNFSFEQKQDLPIAGGAQVEAITFVKNTEGKITYYISCEAVNIKLGANEALSPAKLYQLRY